MKKWWIFLTTCLILICLYFIWYYSDRNGNVAQIYTHPTDYSSYGSNQDRGNILAVQPFLIPADYASEHSFRKALEYYLASARAKGYLTPKTVVVFPEYIGTWLVVAHEKNAVYKAPNITEAMQPIVLCHSISFLKELAFVSNNAKDTVKYSLFKIKAKKAAQIYQNVFSGLAKKYQVTIVAGSIILPTPRIQQGKLIIGHGKLYTISVVYRPSGEAYSELVRKSFPTSAEQPFVTRGSPDELPVFQTPAGRLGVLICADAWYPISYKILKQKQVDIIAVPSHKSMDSKFDNPWSGYNGYPAPDDVNPADIKKITEAEALRKYALAGRISSSGARYGVDVFLRGDFWNIGGDGYTTLVDDGKVIQGKYLSGAALLNFWLR